MKTVFLDRDGVINKERPGYVKSWSEFEVLPGSLDALHMLTLHGYRIIVVTNQSVISRKLVAEPVLREIHEKMQKLVAAHGSRIDAIYHCPHLPGDGCSCRKPAPGLIYQAQTDYQLDLSETCMIGDSLIDMQCARRAGCGKAVLVRTGHGVEADRLRKEANITPDFVADDLMAAVEWLLIDMPNR